MTTNGKEQGMKTERALTSDGKRPEAEIDQVAAGVHSDPHRILGVHGTTVRALRPGASTMFIDLPEGAPVEMQRVHDGGVYEGQLPSEEHVQTYRLRAEYADAPAFVYDDPYKAWPTLGEMDLYLFGEGRHHELWRVLGAHRRCHAGVWGTSFAV